MPITLDKMVEEIKSLAPHERRRLREVLNSLPDEDDTAKIGIRHREKMLEQRLLNKGIISYIPAPIVDLTPYQNRKLITIRGKSLSETILEERR